MPTSDWLWLESRGWAGFGVTQRRGDPWATSKVSPSAYLAKGYRNGFMHALAWPGSDGRGRNGSPFRYVSGGREGRLARPWRKRGALSSGEPCESEMAPPFRYVIRRPFSRHLASARDQDPIETARLGGIVGRGELDRGAGACDRIPDIEPSAGGEVGARLQLVVVAGD